MVEGGKRRFREFSHLLNNCFNALVELIFSHKLKRTKALSSAQNIAGIYLKFVLMVRIVMVVDVLTELIALS